MESSKTRRRYTAELRAEVVADARTLGVNAAAKKHFSGAIAVIHFAA